MPPGINNTQRQCNPYYRDVKWLTLRVCSVSLHTYPARPFARLSPSELGPLVHYSVRIGFRTYRVNGTVVLSSIGLWGQADLAPNWKREIRVREFPYARNPKCQRAALPQECLTHLRPTP